MHSQSAPQAAFCHAQRSTVTAASRLANAPRSRVEMNSQSAPHRAFGRAVLAVFHNAVLTCFDTLSWLRCVVAEALARAVAMAARGRRCFPGRGHRCLQSVATGVYCYSSGGRGRDNERPCAHLAQRRRRCSRQSPACDGGPRTARMGRGQAPSTRLQRPARTLRKDGAVAHASAHPCAKTAPLLTPARTLRKDGAFAHASAHLAQRRRRWPGTRRA